MSWLHRASGDQEKKSRFRLCVGVACDVDPGLMNHKFVHRGKKDPRQFLGPGILGPHNLLDQD